MLRRLHLIMAALAMLIAPVAMQSGVAMAAMPMDHGEMTQAEHCGDADPDPEKDDESGAKSQCCCIAMCSAIAPPGAAPIEPISYRAPLLFGSFSTQHRPFSAELPTPPPRAA